ncbi:pentapeptide repeat-containing protein [Streptomyces sp. SS8]
MTHPSPAPPPYLPGWPHCGHGAATGDPIGCRGIRVTGHTACLAHLDEADRAAYLAGLSPGTELDHSGTPFTTDLLSRLLGALHDPATGWPRLGAARFDQAIFIGIAWFAGASFAGHASFNKATFTDVAQFNGASFAGHASFDEATFTDMAQFNMTSFAGHAWFGEATFAGHAWFGEATFAGHAWFGEATFAGDTWFGGASFSGNVWFNEARFETAAQLGPLVCGGMVELGGAVFGAPVAVEIAAERLSLWRTRWASTAALRLRYAKVDLTGAVLEHPLTLAVEPAPFTIPLSSPLSEEVLTSRDAGVRVVALGGVDAAHLTLTDADLSECRFAGAVHLDQLRVGGRADFARPPAGWHRRGLVPARWSRRQTLAEEHHWRAATARRATPAEATRGWQPGPHHPDAQYPPGPRTVATLYRALRKAFEDGKDEPGAADFYYGEMEMRRHDTTRPWGERALLAAYWAVSGYGLRAARALTWLGATMLVTVVLLMGFGIPEDSPKQEATGTVPPGGGTVALTIGKADPQNPTGDRFTGERFEKALNVTLNSVVFRSSGQDLTTAGTYTEMASRLVEPVLLGLAVLAVRNRVKR